MGTKRRQLVALALVLAACTSSASQADDIRGSNEETGPILYVSRDRAAVGDSDDIHGAFLEIERASPNATACLHLHRTTPEGLSYTQIALLASAPDEVGEDSVVINGMTVSSGDFIRGDGELGSAERPAALAEAHSIARAGLIEACAPLKLEERFDQVFDTAPIIFIEEVETRP